ncbi:MAG: hypothetical protein GOP50_13610 [Candidatus Heimdallarchaeota archaeon]|nr:hypothetical protein [Candidatus Heimdallarchaeota archaeon]
MDVQDSTDTSYYVSQLIDSLTSGEINPSDFGVKINQYSQTMTKNLFRDSLPKFISNLRSKTTDVFFRYFFNNESYQDNDLWKFVDYKDFWVQLRNFHDYIYSRSMDFTEVIQFFEETLSSTNSQPRLSYLEQRVIEQLDQTPYFLNKDLAKKFHVSEKKISHLMNGLRAKGISLGSSVDYSALGFYEFFTLGTHALHDDTMVVVHKYELFPSFSMGYGVSSEKISASSIYDVINKKIICNTRILTLGISLKDWSKNSVRRVKMPTPIQGEQTDFYVTPVSKDYILRLVRNCETNFKRPNIKQIANIFDVSIRTLFRIKSKLKDIGILEPRIILENKELMIILMISEKELVEFYNKVPFIRSYEVQDGDNNVKWMTFLSIFPSDFNFIYKKSNKSVDIFQVIEKNVLDQTTDNEKILLHLNQKT